MEDKGTRALTGPRIAGIVIAAVVVVLGISWAVQGSSWFMFDVFAPRYEKSRRETFEESKAYNQGMIQELQNMQFEYLKADEDHKKALADVILHRAADYDREKLPPDLKEFISKLEKERTTAH